MASDWTIHKFGGSSVVDAAAMRRVVELVARDDAHRSGIVVSAMGGVTDALLALTDAAAARDAGYERALENLRQRHWRAVADLLDGRARDALASRIDSDFDEIRDLLRAIWLMRRSPRNLSDLIVGFGEQWSARILAALLAAGGERADWLDARKVLVVHPGESAPVVDWAVSSRQVAEWIGRTDARRVVITGFIASDAEGASTTLGRNGSDYSASIFGALLDAASITIWTDVDGVMSADPRQVGDAHVIDRLSYNEAMELAYFGAKVLHPQTMAPAIERSIPITIRNTFRPETGGTVIQAGVDDTTPVKGFATIDGMALINLEGTGMIGVPGIAERLFGALREGGVSVVLISQGSSEHSICFAVPERQAEAARQATERAFFAERHQGQIQAPQVTEGCAILAAVGDGMAGIPGIAATFFGALGKAGINVRAIAQGSSERNISVVLDADEATRALRAAHAGFYLSNQTLSVGLIGAGLVGTRLLEQLAGQVERLRDEFRIDIRVRAIARRRVMVLHERAVALDGWSETLEREGRPTELDRLVDHVRTDGLPHAVLIDCTADAAVADRYVEWLERGIHVITPNKKANTTSMAAYRRLRRASRRLRRHYLYETTVGAALPVIQTLRDLIQTGDEVLRIEGILSGTLSYLFNSFDGRRPFSEIVREARAQGYTEPDPREDLSGMDVARKVVILAREMGLELELDDLEVESLVPSGLEDGSVEEFLSSLGEHDARMRHLLEDARSAGEVLRFVGTVDPGGVSSVRLRRYPADHPFGRIALTDNIVQFRTRRYHDNPLVIQGPGAGTDVTAGGIFADLLRLATYLGATL